MIAGLPMYERPENAAAHDRLWTLTAASLRDHGVQAPEHLTRDIDPWDLWRRPDLVLAQTCGLPYRNLLHGEVTLIATPVSALPGPPGHYHSVIVAHAGDLRDASEFDQAMLAVNDGRSQSGWAAALDWAGETGITLRTKLTGAHRASAQAVANREADLAAIDALSWEFLTRWDGFTHNLRVIAQTAPTPALPYIAAKTADAEATRAALHQAIAALTLDDKHALGLTGITQIPASAYLVIPTPPPPGE